MQNSMKIQNCQKIRIFTEIRAKMRKKFDEFLRIFWVWSGAKVCKSCRSRKMLKNAYLVAKIGFDTEENEPSKVWSFSLKSIELYQLRPGTTPHAWSGPDCAISSASSSQRRLLDECKDTRLKAFLVGCNGKRSCYQMYFNFISVLNLPNVLCIVSYYVILCMLPNVL